MTTFPKVTTVYTTNLQSVSMIHMEFAFYNVISIQGFTCMLTLVYTKTIMLWVFFTPSKGYPIQIIHFILTALNNEQHPCICVRVNNDGALENSTYVTNLIVDYFSISMENTGCCA